MRTPLYHVARISEADAVLAGANRSIVEAH